MTRVVSRTFKRADRVGGQVQRVLADLIQRGVNDPRLSQATITAVTMNRDLRIAKVYFTTHNSTDKQSLLESFEKAKGFIKRELARELGLRYMPDLRFYYDTSVDYGAHINRVLKSLHANDTNDTPTAEKE